MLQFLTQHIHKLQAVIIKSKSLNKCKLFYFTIKLFKKYCMFRIFLCIHQFNYFKCLLKGIPTKPTSCLNSLYLVWWRCMLWQNAIIHTHCTTITFHKNVQTSFWHVMIFVLRQIVPSLIMIILPIE